MSVPRMQILANHEKCVGCCLCELVCSFHHEGVFQPSLSRITVVSDKEKSIDIPVTCHNCEKAPCKAVCPQRAIYRDDKTSAIIVDESLCIGCLSCLEACPFGAPTYIPSRGVVAICDQCGGSPECVKICPTGALQYVDASQASYAKKLETVKGE